MRFFFSELLRLNSSTSSCWAANKSMQTGAEQDTPVLHVYGPGGPLPTIKKAADAFSREKYIPEIQRTSKGYRIC
jgi:accessory colonization factor AcfC